MIRSHPLLSFLWPILSDLLRKGGRKEGREGAETERERERERERD
jgi:hypothetical protein